MQVVDVFLASARVVAHAIADSTVAAAWDQPSVLEGQMVSGLAGHLCRAVLVVGSYLDGGEPAGPVDLDSAAGYFAASLGVMSADHHRAVRERGAATASVGRDELLATLTERTNALELLLCRLGPSHLVTVIMGKVMRLGDYLGTRIVEMTVHLDDLARSVGREPWPLPEAAEALTITIGAEIGRRHLGAATMLRALYRSGFAGNALPVL